MYYKKTKERSQELQQAAYDRLLSVVEQAELVFLLWKGSAATFVRTVNKAYALARKNDAGSLAGDDHSEMSRCFDLLGSADFRVLYAAVENFANPREKT